MSGAVPDNAVPNDAVPDEVAVSIIVICWNVVDEFRECLDAVAGLVDAPPFEVIVVLNGAPTASREIAESHSVVTRLIDLQANIGFGAAANLAASVAVGRYLAFLNDDARVDPGWLAALVAARREGAVPSVVASLMLNVDGTVQEAGSRLLSHGGTVQLGRGLSLDDPAAAAVLRPREIDYGSAAALLVEHRSFDEIGGFDPIYEPAYYEDVDLQLRLRERGYPVWFEPKARVSHYLGRSTDQDHWFRTFAANRSGRHFVTRWAGVLTTAATEDDPVDVLAAVPRAERAPATPRAWPPEADHSVQIAAEITKDYQRWLIERVQEAGGTPDDAPMSDGPPRRELVASIAELGARVADLEKRGVIGVARMRLGVALARRGLFRPRRSR